MIFRCFHVKTAVLDRVSMAVGVVDGAGGLCTMRDGVCEEKTAVFGEISLVEYIFRFFLPFPGSV